MTEVSFDKTEKAYVFECKGHAGFAGKGYDVLCASISILSYTLAQTAITLHEQGFLTKKPNIKIEDGFTKIVMKPHKGMERDVHNAIAVVQIGFLLLTETEAYSPFVSLVKTV